MWMNKSLKYGVLIIPYWPMKAWWATRKVRVIFNSQFAKMSLLYDFPVAPEGHPTANIKRSYIWGGYTLPAKEEVAHH